MDLAARWASVVSAWGAPMAEIARVGSSVVDRYAEPHRRYHTVAHLDAVLDALFLDLAADPAAVVLAAFFHDAVYDARVPRAANETASAALAVADLRTLGARDPMTSAVSRLVMTTVEHRVATGDADAAVLADADLSILGAAPPAYDAYARAVREEYGWLTDAVWRAGRSAVLQAFLDRPRLYVTDRGRARWEVRARANLGAELSRLLAEP